MSTWETPLRYTKCAAGHLTKAGQACAVCGPAEPTTVAPEQRPEARAGSLVSQAPPEHPHIEGVDLSARFQRSSRGAKIILIAFGLSVLSLFLPWVEIGFASASGFQQQAFIMLLFPLYPTIAAARGKGMSRPAGLILGLLGAGATIAYIASKSAELFGVSVNGAGSGAYLFLCCCIATAVGAWLYTPTAPQQTT